MGRTLPAARYVEVFAATCSGLRALSRKVGTSVVCIRASSLAKADIAAMNEIKHAALTLNLNGNGRLDEQEGFADWATIPFGSTKARGEGASAQTGRLRVFVPVAVSDKAFEVALHGVLGRYRFDPFGSTPSAPAGRSSPIGLRFTGRLGRRLLVEDLFAVDPATQAAMLARLARFVRDDLVRHGGAAANDG